MIGTRYQISPVIGRPAELQKNLPVTNPGPDDGDRRTASKIDCEF